MNKLTRIKTIVLFICSGIVGTAMADEIVVAQNKKKTESPSEQAAMQAAISNDAKLTSDVTAALDNNGNKLDITVKDSVVYLIGQLPSEAEYEKIVTATRAIKGVKDVNVHKLTIIGNSQPLYDSYLSAKVKGALMQANITTKDTSGMPLNIETKDSRVFLTGKVATAQEKQTIIEVVKSVKGVTKIHDKIVVISN